MVDASQSFALIYKVLAQKCAVVQDLVQSAIFNIEKNDKAITEEIKKSPSTTGLNTNTTNNNDKDNKHNSKGKDDESANKK